MAKKIEPKDISGLKDFAALKPLLERLHTVGTERDKAGNRDLHMDHYCLLLLMWLYNPIIDSLRGLQQASQLANVRKRLGVGRSSLGSLSESVSIFDPERLKELADELSEQLPVKTPEKFDVVDKKITAVDGSVFKILGQIAKLAWLPTAGGKKSCGFRLHTQFEVFRGTPSRIDVTSSNPQGEADERVVLEKSVEGGRCYLIDRGYQKYGLFNAIAKVESNYVCRIRDDLPFTVLEDKPLTEADREARVVSDQLVKFGTPNSRTPPPDHATRLVIIQAKPHNSNTKKGVGGPDCDGYIRIVTNILDVPAEIIAALYSLRWTIELYFRMIKQLLGCRHLLSKKPEGVEIQAYMAIIACLLILVHTGCQPTKRTYEMICFYLLGWASLEELETHIAKLKPQKA